MERKISPAEVLEAVSEAATSTRWFRDTPHRATPSPSKRAGKERFRGRPFSLSGPSRLHKAKAIFARSRWSGRWRGFKGVRPPGGGCKGEASPLSPPQAKGQTTQREIPSGILPGTPAHSRCGVLAAGLCPPTTTATKSRDGPSVSPGLARKVGTTPS